MLNYFNLFGVLLPNDTKGNCGLPPPVGEYHFFLTKKWTQGGSNPRPSAHKTDALPTELRDLCL